MKISKEKLTFLKNTPIITLETIHDMLDVKQHINNYQRNTNKKYGINFERNEIINREIADIIIINTLGKLNMLPEQCYFLRLVRNTEANSPKIRKAKKFAQKADIANKIVEILDFINGNAILDINETSLYNFIKKEKVRNLKYFSRDGREEWFFDRVKWLLDTYKRETK